MPVGNALASGGRTAQAGASPLAVQQLARRYGTSAQLPEQPGGRSSLAAAAGSIIRPGSPERRSAAHFRCKDVRVTGERRAGRDVDPLRQEVGRKCVGVWVVR